MRPAAGMERQPRPIRVFCSYAHEDAEYRVALEKHLSPLIRGNVIELWHDREIVAGQTWAEQIDEHLADAELIVLLISADFLASRYCFEIEMEYALGRHKAGAATVVPVIIRSVDWAGVPINFLQALPTDAKAVDSWANEDAAWTNVAQGIRAAVATVRPLVSASAGGGAQAAEPDIGAADEGSVTATETSFHARDKVTMKHVLLVVSGEQRGERFMLPEGASLLVGRDERCRLRLSPSDRNASRRHARIEVAGGQLYVTDLDSKNGTYVDGRRFERREVERDQEIACGDTIIRVEEAPEPDRTLTQMFVRQPRIVLRDEQLDSAIEAPTFLESLMPVSLRNLFGD